MINVKRNRRETMEIAGELLNLALIILSVIGVIISHFESGEERIITLVWVAILLSLAGL